MDKQPATVVRDDGVAGSNPATPTSSRTDTCTVTPLPCPFCGDEAHVWYFRDRGFFRVRIVCDTCCVQGPATHHHDVADVIAAWNRRVSPSKGKKPMSETPEYCLYGDEDKVCACGREGWGIEECRKPYPDGRLAGIFRGMRLAGLIHKHPQGEYERYADRDIAAIRGVSPAKEGSPE